MSDCPDGLFRCKENSPASRVSSEYVVAGEAAGDILCVVTTQNDAGTIMLAGPDSSVLLTAECPPGRLESMAATRHGEFLLLFREHSGTRGFRGTGRIVRVSTTDGLLPGPPLENCFVSHFPFITTDPPRVIDSPNVFAITPDLTVSAEQVLGGRLLSGQQSAGSIWIVTHPPDRTGRGGWWPLRCDSAYPRSPQYWLLTRLNPDTLLPEISVPVHHPCPRLTATADGQVWLVARGVRRLPDVSMQPPPLVDLGEAFGAGHE